MRQRLCPTAKWWIGEQGSTLILFDSQKILEMLLGFRSAKEVVVEHVVPEKFVAGAIVESQQAFIKIQENAFDLQSDKIQFEKFVETRCSDADHFAGMKSKSSYFHTKLSQHRTSISIAGTFAR